MAKRRMSPTEQLLLVVALAVVGGYFFLNQVHDPLVKQHKAAIERHNKTVAELNRLKSEPPNLQALKLAIRRIEPQARVQAEAYRQVAEANLSPAGRLEETAMQVNAMACDNGLMVQEFKPVAVEEAGLFTAMAAERKLLERSCYGMKVSGDYLDFYQFMKELKKLRPLANVANLRIEAEGDGGAVSVSMVVLI